MGNIIIFFATALVVTVLMVRNFRNKRLRTTAQKLIQEINDQYRELFKEKSILGRFVNIGLLIVGQLFVSMNIIISVTKYVDTYLNDTFDLILKIIIILMGLALVYFIVGYVLLSSSKIYRVFHEVEDKNIKIDLLLSYFMLSVYFSILLIFPEQFVESYKIGMVGVMIGYLLNFRVLIKAIGNPKHIKSKTSEQVSSSNIISVAILMLLMMVLYLFLGVCFINSSQINAYSGIPNNFDLFYYTIITFTTIGYGDIVPISMGAKIMSIVISTTSVICLTIFLSSILSYKDS